MRVDHEPEVGQAGQVQVLFDQTVFVHYGFWFLTPADEEPFVDLDASRHGQKNGLLGAAAPGRLAMVTGTHTGAVRIRVEWSDHQPASDPEWEDAVEASLDADTTEWTLSAFEEFHDVRLPVAGSHRVRYSAIAMDAGAPPLEEDDLDREVAPDRYLLQLCPAPPATDAIVRQTSDIAAYWHGVARTPSRAGAEEPAAGDVPGEAVMWSPPANAATAAEIGERVPAEFQDPSRIL